VNHLKTILKHRKSIIITASTVLVLSLILLGISLQYIDLANRYADLNIDVGTSSIHVTVYITRSGGEKEYWDHHAGVLSTIGKNWIEDQLGDSPSTDPAKWISVSTDTGTPSAAWTQIPTEIAAGGLTRAVGAYTSTGDGVWTIVKEFTATATHTDVQLTGLQYAVSGDNNLLGADTFTPVTLYSDDKLEVTWTITVT